MKMAKTTINSAEESEDNSGMVLLEHRNFSKIAEYSHFQKFEIRERPVINRNGSRRTQSRIKIGMDEAIPYI